MQEVELVKTEIVTTDDRRPRLWAWKTSTGQTWTEVSRKLGFDLSYIFRVAAGDRPVTDSFVGKFAQAYGFDVAGQVFGEHADQGSETA
jgi:hypothetical protein